MSNNRNVKIKQKFASPFKVLERTERLAYCIELPPAMEIHPVISVVHLDLAPNPVDDPYNSSFSQAIIENSDLRPKSSLGNVLNVDEIEVNDGTSDSLPWENY